VTRRKRSCYILSSRLKQISCFPFTSSFLPLMGLFSMNRGDRATPLVSGLR
jgi:hypothetical protein